MDFSSMLNQAKSGAESGEEAPVSPSTTATPKNDTNSSSEVKETVAPKQSNEKVTEPTAPAKESVSPTVSPVNEDTSTPAKAPESPSAGAKQAQQSNTPAKDDKPAETNLGANEGVSEETIAHIIGVVDAYRGIIKEKANNLEHLNLIAGVLGMSGATELKNEPKTINTILNTDKELFTLFDTLTSVRKLPVTEQIFELLEYDNVLLGNIYNILSGLFPDTPRVKGSNTVETVRIIHPLINKLGDVEDELFKDLVSLLEVVHRS